jgi:predicted MFS family arabinose efflux permease
MTPLRDPRFRLLWAGQLLSGLGDSVIPISLTLAIVKATHSATQLGVVLAAETIAQVSLMLPGGVWADRLPRQRIMLTTDLVRAVAVLVMGLELISGTVDIAQLALLAACSGAASAFFLPSITGLVPSTVDAALLPRANALMAISSRGSLLLGPAIATTVAVTLGPGWSLMLPVVTFSLSALSLALLRVTPPSARARERFVTQLAEGWGHLRRNRWYWSNLVGHCGWNLARCILYTLGPLVAVQSLGGEVAWGTIVQGGALGALAGALIAVRLRPKRWILVVSNLSLTLGALPFPLLAVHAPPLLIAAAWGVGAGGLAFMSPLWDTAVQQHIPEEALSRVIAYDWLLSLGLNPLGMAMAGPLAVAIGIAPTLYGAAVVIVVPCLAVLLLPDVRRLGLAGGERHPGVRDPAEVLS